MAKSAVTLPVLKRSGIAGIKEMRNTVGHIIDRTGAQGLKEVFMKAGEIFYQALKQNAPRPSKGNKRFPAGAVSRNIFITSGTPTKPNVLVGVSKREGAARVALWYEFGTVKQRPRPFFRWSLAFTRPQMAQIIAEGIRDTMTKAADEP